MKHYVQFRVPGSPWVWLAPNGTGSMNLDGAETYPTREYAEKVVWAMTGPRSSIEAKAVSR